MSTPQGPFKKGVGKTILTIASCTSFYCAFLSGKFLYSNYLKSPELNFSKILFLILGTFFILSATGFLKMALEKPLSLPERLVCALFPFFTQ